MLLNITRGDIETGYYNAAYGLVFATLFLSNTINTSLYPSLARRAMGSPESLPLIYGRLARYLLLAQTKDPVLLKALRARDMEELRARITLLETQPGLFDSAWLVDDQGELLVASGAVGHRRA